MKFQLIVRSKEYAGTDGPGGATLTRVRFDLLPSLAFGSGPPAGQVQLVILNTIAKQVDVDDVVNVQLTKV